jgi:pyruvate dehydrogenase E1 component beta subunit
MRRIRYNQAINEALREEMARDERVLLLGEGVQTSTFGTLTGLVDQFGPDRVMDTPMAETAIAGMAVGASLMGYRPIADLMFVDFMYIAADEIMLKAAQWRMMQGGTQKLPCVFLANMGGYRKLGNEHSRCPYSLFLHHPGLKLVVPADAYDAKGLMKTAVRDNNPVVYLFHKGLLGVEGEVPEEEYTVPFGVANVRQEGTDVTVVATGLMVMFAMAAAAQLKDRYSVEVIDPRTLEPLDLDTILRSVRKTGRVVIVDEDTERCGFAGELGMQIMEHAFYDLDGPVKRVCAANYPIPAGPLENHVLPRPEKVVAAIEEVMA